MVIAVVEDDERGVLGRDKTRHDFDTSNRPYYGAIEIK